MAYNSQDFDSTVETLGQKYSQPEDLGRTIKIALTSSTFQFATQTLAEDEDEWTDAINEETLFVLPYVYENEDMSGEAVYQEFAGGDSLKIQDGNYGERLKIYLSVADMRKLASYKNKTWRMFRIDDKGNILGTTPDDTIFQGFELTSFDVEKMNLTAGDVKRLIPITYKERESTEWVEDGVCLQPTKLTADSWDPRDLDGLTDLELTVDSSIATKVVVSVEAHLKGVAIIGLTAVTDFILLTTAGAAQTITGVADNADGSYDLAGTGLETGTLTLGEPEDLTLDGYKSTGTQVVTI